MGLRFFSSFLQKASPGFALLLLLVFSIGGTGCTNGKQRLTLNAQFQSSVAKGIFQKQFTCQTVVFPTGNEATNLLVLPTTHFIPVDENEIPENNFQIQILDGALFEAEGSLTVQLTCTPTGEAFLGFNIFNVFIGETNFVTDACGSGECDLNLMLSTFLDQEFILGLSCPSLNFVVTSILLFGFCDPEEDPDSLGCTALQFAEEAAELTDCVLLSSPNLENCGDGVFDPETEQCDSSAEGGEAPCGTDSCSDLCTCESVATGCGNGLVDEGEECDASAEGGEVPCGSGSCDQACACEDPETCENSVLDEGEECDPTAPDGSAACEAGEACGTPDCVCMPAPPPPPPGP